MNVMASSTSIAFAIFVPVVVAEEGQDSDLDLSTSRDSDSVGDGEGSKRSPSVCIKRIRFSMLLADTFCFAMSILSFSISMRKRIWIRDEVYICIACTCNLYKSSRLYCIYNLLTCANKVPIGVKRACQ